MFFPKTFLGTLFKAYFIQTSSYKIRLLDFTTASEKITCVNKPCAMEFPGTILCSSIFHQNFIGSSELLFVRNILNIKKKTTFSF